MKELQRKHRTKRIIYSTPSLIILLIITFFLAKGAIRVIDKGWQSMERSKELKDKADSIVLREDELRANIARLQTEEGIKEEIKEKFSVVQEDEYVAVIVDEKGKNDAEEGDGIPWYKRLWTAIIRSK